MGRILLFNPSHEMALAANAAHYTPPKQIQQMEADLCRLPLLWAEDGDCVLTSNESVNPSLVPTPWGWNKSVRNRFLRQGANPALMPSEQQLDAWRNYSSRAWAADYCQQLYHRWQDGGLVHNHVGFIHSTADYEAWLSQYGYAPYIVKSEYSSSGRGNRVCNDKQSIKNYQLSTINYQRFVIDTFYEKLLDFAMEFEITKQEVRCLGLSVFKTTSEGRYAFNYLRSQQQLNEMIVGYLPDASVIDRLKELHRQLLSFRLLGHNEGIVGIDMMVVQGGLIHPCVEINLRMNMGVVAMKLFEKGLTFIPRFPYGGQHFYPVIEDGKFFIAYSSAPSSEQ